MTLDALTPSGALFRQRLHQMFAAEQPVRVWVMLAPAGYGKSTVLQQLVHTHATSTRPVVLVNALEGGLMAGTLLETVQTQAAEAGHDLQQVTIAIDDVHLLAGTEALADLQQLINNPGCRLVLSGRYFPQVDLTSLRVAGALCEIGSDDLRFRSWEVEDLFRHVYSLRFPPSELAMVASATGGWAVGLQLYRHATSRVTSTSRISRLQSLRQCRLDSIRTYLATNVLDELDPPLRDFAIRVSVLGKLTPQGCNRLLERIDSEEQLAQLIEHQLFVSQRVDGSLRFHDVFRSFLEARLDADLCASERRRLYHVAGHILLDQNARVDAVRAFAMGGFIDEAECILATLRSGRPEPSLTALDLPEGLLSDHRLGFTRCLQVLQGGFLLSAGEQAARIARETSDNDTGDADLSKAAGRLSRALTFWVNPSGVESPMSWTEAFSELLSIGGHRGAADDQIVEATGHLLAGHPVKATATLQRASVSRRLRPAEQALEAVVHAVGWWLVDGLRPGEALRATSGELDQGSQYLARLVRAIQFIDPYATESPLGARLDDFEEEVPTAEDPWSIALAQPEGYNDHKIWKR
jgi:hypothetical protein